MTQFGSQLDKRLSDRPGIIIPLHFISVNSPLWLNSEQASVGPVLMAWGHDLCMPLP
ncbi:hypothetical protein SPRA44_520016 [Serratia proteamaculans]|nr:hypothetical protein SPRA44_520016 [Serratia proteamaculans]